MHEQSCFADVNLSIFAVLVAVLNFLIINYEKAGYWTKMIHFLSLKESKLSVNARVIWWGTWGSHF